MEKLIQLNNTYEAQILFGEHDYNLKLIEKELSVRLVSRGIEVKIIGRQNNVEKAYALINEIACQIRESQAPQKIDIYHLIKAVKENKLDEYVNSTRIKFRNRIIGPKTKGQSEYVDAIKAYDIVFSIGPAGTGKTYLAVAKAVEALREGTVRRIILTRPAIEAGESLGFLPGTMHEKIFPYIRPLYDALYDMMEAERIEKYIETGLIEVAPLAYMRGRTLNDAFIILDEAQNATKDQVKMFLTRLGFDSKAVITGDITQSDLPDGRPEGLIQAQEALKEIEGIKFVYLSGADVVRHQLIQEIIKAYAKINTGN